MAHDAETRADAQALLLEGATVRTVARAMKVAPSTVGEWRKVAFAESRQDSVATPPTPSIAYPKVPATPAAAGAPAAGSVAAVDPVTGLPPGPPEPEYDETAPKITDRLWMQAISRYVSLINNKVPHYAALHAVQQIDPDFELEEGYAMRVHEMLGNTDEPVLMGGPGPGSIKPPEYVSKVYDAYEMGPSDIAKMADAIYATALDAYREGINAQLVALGHGPITQVTDPDILNVLYAESRTTAAGIVETFNRNLASSVYVQWIDLRSAEGRQASEAKLRDRVEKWASDRAEWKAPQIALTESNHYYNRAVRDFAARNADLNMVWKGYVTPDGCECDGCRELVDVGMQPEEMWIGVNLPLHANCQHELWWVYVDDARNVPRESIWSAQGEVGASLALAADEAG